MKKLKIVILILTFISIETLANTYEIDKVVAIVNNDIILYSDIEFMLKIFKINIKNIKLKSNNYYNLRSKILDHLIMNTIILQLAKQMQINVHKNDIQNVFKDISNQNKLTVKEMEKYLHNNGIKLSKFFDEIRKEIMISTICNNIIRNRVKILPKEIDSLAKQIYLQSNLNMKINFDYIIILILDKDNQENLNFSKLLLDKVLNDLKNGVNFDKIIKIYSKENKIFKTGNVNWLQLQDLPIIFSEKLKNSKKGDIIGPIRSNIGYNILRVNNVKNKNKIIVTEVKVQHIFIKSQFNKNNNHIKEKITEIYNNINNGKISFSDVVKKNSKDVNVLFEKNNLDWNNIEIYDQILRATLLKLKKGELSKPIFSNFGWHLIRLKDIRFINKENSFYKKQAYNLIFYRKFNEKLELWMQEQKAAAYIEIIDNNNIN